VALAAWPKMPLMIFPKMLIVGSQWTSSERLEKAFPVCPATPDADRRQNLTAPAFLANAD
jgi:hypothetical protein